MRLTVVRTAILLSAQHAHMDDVNVRTCLIAFVLFTTDHLMMDIGLITGY